MSIIENISVVEDVTLVSLKDSPADIGLISSIFQMIADAGIDVDMISQTPHHSKMPDLSFTISDDDFSKILEIMAQLRQLNPDLKLTIQNGNCKISVFGESMKGTPGVAVKVFNALNKANADIIMITTSEVDISMLVSKHDLDTVLECLNEIQ